MRDYMKALIISPKNISIHTNNTVPLELYTDADVRKVVVKVNDRVVYSQTLTNDGYFADQLSLSPNGIEDMELAFEFYGKNDKLLKTESILILASSAAFDLPRLSGVGSTNLSPSSTTAYVLTGTRTTAALGTEIVKATNVVGLVPGVASNWSLVDNFDFYNPGFLGKR